MVDSKILVTNNNPSDNRFIYGTKASRKEILLHIFRLFSVHRV